MISTVVCSVVSTPQMVLTDRLMAGVYPSFPVALQTIMKKEGIRGFYSGWWPALAQKFLHMGTYGFELSEVVDFLFKSCLIVRLFNLGLFSKESKRLHKRMFQRKPSGDVSFMLGAVAAAAAVVRFV